MNTQEIADRSHRIGVRGDNDRTGEDELLTPSDVAALFHVDPKTVTRWAQAGKIGCITAVGGHPRFRHTEIHALLNALPDPVAASSDVDAAPDTR